KPPTASAAGGRRTPHALTSPVGLRHVAILAAGRSTKATGGLPPPTPKRASAVADGRAAARCAASPGVPEPPAEQREGCDDDLRGLPVQRAAAAAPGGARRRGGGPPPARPPRRRGAGPHPGPARWPA